VDGGKGKWLRETMPNKNHNLKKEGGGERGEEIIQRETAGFLLNYL